MEEVLGSSAGSGMMPPLLMFKRIRLASVRPAPLCSILCCCLEEPLMISCLLWKMSAHQHSKTHEIRNQQPFEARSVA